MVKKAIVLFIFTVISFSAYSQPGDPGGDPDVPIGGIELLLLAGGAFGFRKMIKKK